MRADILLTHGYSIWDDPHELATMRPCPPLGILYLSAYLKREGMQVDVLDSTFARRDHFSRHIAKTKPPLVGIYTNMMTRQAVLRMSAVAQAKGSKVILGGPDPANYPLEYLQRGADIVVIGEGEETLTAIVKLSAAGKLGPDTLREVAGVAFLEGDELVKTPARAQIPKLDSVPWPDREAIDIDAYIETWRRHHGHGSVSLITARGCPFHCQWCSHAVYGHSHRRRSVTDVADEVEYIIARYQPDMLWYADDVFTIHKRWFFKYAEELLSRGVRIPFETISREDRLDEKIVAKLAEIGCKRIWVGAESGSQRVLDRMQRSTDAERVIEMVHLLQKYGIEAGMFIMLGYDGEEQSDLEQTVRVLERAAPDIFLTTVSYPIKDTGYFAAVQDKVVAHKSWDEGSDRDLSVAGRHSQRYYAHATRWMVGEVGWRSQIRKDGFAPGARRQIVRQFANAAWGRLGMWRSRDEREGADARG
jgi:anaerobic magnesium-protoporphyrin IX monomethyl ester cyclase